MDSTRFDPKRFKARLPAIWSTMRPTFMQFGRFIMSALLVFVIILIMRYSFVNIPLFPMYYTRKSLEKTKLEERKDRILCAIMTMPSNHHSKAVAVRDTWSKRCDGILFFSSKEDPSFLNSSLIALNVTEGRAFLWHKTRAAFLYMEENHGDQFDWFLKSDDDTYFILENLRAFLSDYDPDDRIWSGCELVLNESKQSFHFPSGGAGYVLSRGAIKAFWETVHNDTSGHGCGIEGGSIGEDVRFSMCLSSVGVRLIDAGGPNNTYRFLPTMLEHFVFPERNRGNAWMTRMSRERIGQGIQECCHPRLISMHYTTPKMMYAYEFLIYHLQL